MGFFKNQQLGRVTVSSMFCRFHSILKNGFEQKFHGIFCPLLLPPCLSFPFLIENGHPIGAFECHTHASCINTLGGYMCQCNYGYSGDGKVECVKRCQKKDPPCPSASKCYIKVWGFSSKTAEFLYALYFFIHFY